MPTTQDYSHILRNAYKQFMLPLGGKNVPTPYRRNEYGSYQKLGPEFQGKSSPQTLTQTAKKLAKEQEFDLEKATVEQIREFLRKNQLGIDCSGFVYRMLDALVKGLGRGNLMQAAGVEHVGRTNVAKLTSDELSVRVDSFNQARAGDIIRLNSGDDILHGAIILENQENVLTYAHSSGITNPDGVHSGQIIDGQLTDELKNFSYNLTRGDGIRRLKIFI